MHTAELYQEYPEYRDWVYARQRARMVSVDKPNAMGFLQYYTQLCTHTLNRSWAQNEYASQGEASSS